MTETTRRSFLTRTTAAGLTLLASSPGEAPAVSQSKPAESRPKVAAIFTTFRYRSHAHVILENFLEPYIFCGKRVEPPVDVVSFYADQFSDEDMARETAKKYGIPLYGTIREAMCCGSDRLAVDAALSIAEHGDYPTNEFEQTEYPHKRFFDEIAAVVREADQPVPVFNDKHLSHLWSEAKELYDAALHLKIPLMAGSSVPLAERRPTLKLPQRCEFDDVLVIHGGPIEAYGFHAFELLLSMVESRRGGESGIARVEFLDADALKQAAEDGRWSIELADAAMAAERGSAQSVFELIEGENEVGAHGVLVTHRDGLRSMILRSAGYSDTRWNFACRLKGETKIRATRWHVGPWQNRNLFKALSHAIQDHFVQGKAPYPVERTLMVSGMLDAAMNSLHRGSPVETPDLNFSYETRNFDAMRENGDSWKIITEDSQQPRGIDTADSWLPKIQGDNRH
jgi:hypothetical protein